MLFTDLGEINVTINGIIQQIKAVKLGNRDKRYTVDGRYKIVVDIPEISDKLSVECTLTSYSPINITKIVESGERVAILSFYYEKKKLSIGVEDERVGIQCEYIDNGINVVVSNNANVQTLVFYVAWLTMQDGEKEDIFTWFAADPTVIEIE